jgi:hypothetical protein
MTGVEIRRVSGAQIRDLALLGSSRMTRCCKTLCIVLLTSGSVAQASGSLPSFVEKTKFKSHADCVASLRNDLQQDRDATTNGRIGFRDGMTKQVILITEGLVKQSRNVTTYQSELWRSFGGPVERPAVPERASETVQEPLMRYYANYEKRLRVCKRRVKTVTGEDGYTQDSFE